MPYPDDGTALGTALGSMEGCPEGTAVGIADGKLDGRAEGSALGPGPPRIYTAPVINRQYVSVICSEYR